MSFIASLVVAIALTSIALADNRVASETTDAINHNWRGLYDLLVSAPSQDFGGSTTKGLVDPNFVSTAGDGGVSTSQLDAIRSISDVDVAAPIGFVGELRGVALTPSLVVADDPAAGTSDLTAGSTAIGVTTVLEQSTPSGMRTLFKSSGGAVLTRRSSGTDPFAQSAPISTTPNFAPNATDKYFMIPLGELPAFPSSIIAIDPIAERKLLGEKAAKYLDPLVGLPTQRTTAAQTDWSKLVNEKSYLVQQTVIQSADPHSGQPIVPLLVNASKTKLDLKVEVSKSAVPADPKLSPGQLQSLLDSAQGSLLQKDVSGLTTPFSTPNLTVTEPNTSLPLSEDGGSLYNSATDLSPAIVGRPAYSATTSTDSGTPRFRVRALEVVGPDGSLPNAAAATKGVDPSVGTSRAYRSFTQKLASGPTALPAPVGTFTNRELTDPGHESASYVPTGIAQTTTTTLSQPSTEVAAQLSGLDFITTPPGAFTDLAGGAALRGATPIDAVQVRIAGIKNYSESNLAKVNAVAQKVASMGLRVTVVSGSSPQAIELYVPKYNVPSDGSAGSDLGWVRQEWTTLGASVIVGSALSQLELWLMWSALGAAAIALIGSTVVSARSQRLEVGLLRDVGWREALIRRRYFVRLVPGLTIVAITAVLMLLSSSGTAAVSSGLFAVVVVVSSLVVGALNAFAMPKRSTGSVHQSALRGEVSLSLLHLRRNLVVSGTQVLGFAAVGAAASLTLAAFNSTHRAAGATRLASAVLERTQLASVILGVAGLLAVLVLILLARRSEIRARGAETSVLVEIGFSIRAIQRIRMIETSVIALAAMAITVLMGVFIWQLGGASPVIIFVGMAATAAALITTVAATRKMGRDK